ncbi:MAG: DUF4340 domain-containing protein [Bacteroidales bacterium]
MLSKLLNTKTLILLLAILGVILIVANLNKKEDRTFRSHLADIDTTRVTKMEIIPKTGTGSMITITRSGDEWHLESGGKSYKSDQNAIRNILVEMSGMRTERVAATSKTDWTDFEVTDSTATRLKVYGGKKVLADLYLGKFSYSQPTDFQNPQQRPQTRMFTNVRIAGEEAVYVVEGFLKMSIQPNVNHYRSKILCAAPIHDITRVTFSNPDDQFTLHLDNGVWMVDGQPADSTLTMRYLQRLTRLSGSNFMDEAEAQTPSPTHVIKVEGNNMFPVELKAFPTDPANEYVVTSSLVPDAQYSGTNGDLFERTFVRRESFFPGETSGN